MNKNDLPPPGKDQIGTTRKSPTMQSITEAHFRHDPPHEPLGFGVLALHQAHHPASFFSANGIHNLRPHYRPQGSRPSTTRSLFSSYGGSLKTGRLFSPLAHGRISTPTRLFGRYTSSPTPSSSGWTPLGRGSDGRFGLRRFRAKLTPTAFGTHRAVPNALPPSFGLRSVPFTVPPCFFPLPLK